MAIVIALIDKAIRGDVRAFEVIRDTLGEKPTNNQEIEYPIVNRESVKFQALIIIDF